MSTALKVFISQLWGEVRLKIAGSQEATQMQIYLHNKEITDMVWIQGVIVGISDGNTGKLRIHVDDGSGIIAVSNVEETCLLPGRKSHAFATGDFVMVSASCLYHRCRTETESDVTAGDRSYTVGHVELQAGPYSVSLVGSNPDHESLWIAEVISVQKRWKGGA